ncbi:ActS/PrrB/RegB family redox-sensitive histidine kinase [Epibacterium sp. SM1979]|uniref:histidine kinase n=1 Tax=Tritonibacter litoralis TaxID=2662264 RepID=A0A843YB37_9RHOB|nr:ActS/PrrB/RegB family redox-sensitive histidine kinase [Tritonibacter litoralis]MQQ08186.1 ActS/PrrB/RegB family redox-sensitive histidine kinase [Tritonibacter litoralis]
MSDTNIGLMSGQERSHWIRLRTVIILRWVAIFGQITALFAAQWILGLKFHIELTYITVCVSVLSNLVATFAFPENKRMSEVENLLMILFDLLQLGILLYLTGGLNNPFALLVLGPVTISASMMRLRSALIIGAVAILLVTVLSQVYRPLVTEIGAELRMPGIFIFGNWAAIVIAILFIGAYSYRISSEIRSMSDALAATHLALSREQKLTDLGGVVAAAAHELGTPLATIKLTSAELVDELSDNPDLCEDAQLIREQADRCRDILRDMGRAGKSDLQMRQAPLVTIINEAAEPHSSRGKTLHMEAEPLTETDLLHPKIMRKPEIIHGLRNLVQNGVDFAEGNVWIDASWDDKIIRVTINDDGQGYPSHLLGRIGDPFVRRRRHETVSEQRPEYEGMGLGLFIAKTLLERTGARLRFANAGDPYQDLLDEPQGSGAIVEVTWPRSRIDSGQDGPSRGLGKNVPIEI